MTSVLAKKIATNTRLPPSLLGFRDHWENLEKHVSRWMLESFNIECAPSVERQMNVDAKAATELITTRNAYVLGENFGAVPQAIWFSPSITTRYAAERLGDSPDKLTGTSPVFLKLICEAPTSELVKRLSEWIVLSTSSSAIMDPSDIIYTTDPLEPSNRFIHVEIGMHVDDESFSIGFLLELQQFLSLHSERMRTGISSAGSPGISSTTLKNSVRKSSMDVEAIIDRLDMTIAECSRLTIGQEIELPDANRQIICLVAKTLTGDEEIARGELGVWKHNRALKLSTPVSESFLRNTVDL